MRKIKTSSRFIAILLVLMLAALPLPFSALAASAPDYGDALNGSLQYLQNNASSFPTCGGSSGADEWSVMTLARAGADATGWYKGYYKSVLSALTANGGTLPGALATDYSRVILALTAIGVDASNCLGYDLFAPLSDLSYLKTQAINASVFTLLALDSNSAYATSTSINYPLQDLVDYIVSKADPDSGAWTTSSNPDTDVTSQAIAALAPYSGVPAVETAIKNGLSYLMGQQDDVTGLIINPGWYFIDSSPQSSPYASPDTTAQVIVALVALGIDPEAPNLALHFNGGLVTALLNYALDGGGFYEDWDTSSANDMLTYQAAYALVAYDRFLAGANTLYNMSDASHTVTEPSFVTWFTDENRVPLTALSVGSDEVFTLKLMSGALISGAASPAGNTEIAEINSDGTVGDTLSTTDIDGTFSLKIANTGENTMTYILAPTDVSGASVVVKVAPAPASGGTVTDPQQSVTLTVRDPGKSTTYFSGKVPYTAGDTAYSLLLKVPNLNVISDLSGGIAYVKSINGLAEFANGPQSGWLYKVNSDFPTVSSGIYQVSVGANVQWLYTRDGGQDVDADYVVGGSPSTGSGAGKDDQNSGEGTAGGGNWSNPFSDVGAGAWYYDAVQYVNENGLMNGTGSGFEPDATLTRAMLITILARAAGVDTTAGDTWYGEAAAWGAANGITDGSNLDGNITREQLVTMLYRFAALQGLDTSARADISGFADAGSVSGWANDAMAWAVATGLVEGQTDTSLAPEGTATRAETAAIIMRFLGL